MSSDASQKSLKLSEQIPDYAGYQDFTQRKISDKALRMFLIDTISRMRDQLTQEFTACEPKNQKRLDELVRSTRRKLKTISISLKMPTYEDVQFFASKRISDKLLQRIYALEIQMMLEVDRIVEELAFVTTPELRTTVFEEHFLRIQNFIDNVNQFLFEREALIIGEE